MIEDNIREVKGIILKQIDVKDSDIYIVLLTKDGILDIFFKAAKSIKTKAHKFINLFSEVSLEVKVLNDGTLIFQDGTIIKTYFSIYENVKKINMLNLMAELSIGCLSNLDSTPFVYFQSVLHALDEDFDMFTLLAIYLTKLSYFAGVGFNFENCTICGSKANLIAFDKFFGGFICRDCAQKNSIPKTDITILKIMRYCYLIKENDLKHAILPKIKIKEYNIFMIDTLDKEFTNKAIKSINYFVSLLFA